MGDLKPRGQKGDQDSQGNDEVTSVMKRVGLQKVTLQSLGRRTFEKRDPQIYHHRQSEDGPTPIRVSGRRRPQGEAAVGRVRVRVVVGRPVLVRGPGLDRVRGRDPGRRERLEIPRVGRHVAARVVGELFRSAGHRPLLDAVARVVRVFLDVLVRGRGRPAEGRVNPGQIVELVVGRDRDRGIRLLTEIDVIRGSRGGREGIGLATGREAIVLERTGSDR